MRFSVEIYKMRCSCSLSLFPVNGLRGGRRAAFAGAGAAAAIVPVWKKIIKGIWHFWLAYHISHWQ